MKEVVGYTEVPLEGRFSHVRTQETNLGNLIADLILTEFTHCDVVLLNGGTMRSNSVTERGHLTLMNIRAILPDDDTIIQLKVPGTVLRKALENSVSQYPKLDGRFSSVAGLSFTWNPRKEAGSRVG